MSQTSQTENVTSRQQAPMMTQEAWNSLKYPVSLHPLTDEEGGGWVATIPMLGAATFIADAPTPEEALTELETWRRQLYDLVVKSGKPIPLPTGYTETIRANSASGEWLMRASPQTHAMLQKGAEEHCLNFNAYCAECLQRGHTLLSVEAAVAQHLQAFQQAAQQTLCEIQEKLDRALPVAVTPVGEPEPQELYRAA